MAVTTLWPRRIGRKTIFGKIVFENGLNLAGVFLTKQTQMAKEDGQGQELGSNVDREEAEALPDNGDAVFWKLGCL